MAKSDELYAKAKALREEADAVAKEAGEARTAELREKPLLDRLIFAAGVRCQCGAGMAYDPAGPSGLGEDGGPFKGPLNGWWECSRVLLKDDSLFEGEPLVPGFQKDAHEKLPFYSFDIKSERQPSAQGYTTRPKPKTAV